MASHAQTKKLKCRRGKKNMENNNSHSYLAEVQDESQAWKDEYDREEDFVKVKTNDLQLN